MSKPTLSKSLFCLFVSALIIGAAGSDVNCPSTSEYEASGALEGVPPEEARKRFSALNPEVRSLFEEIT
ncbi:hypothetical protein ACFL1X_09350 [Candidatus Hydrogenedentota bacterium]